MTRVDPWLASCVCGRAHRSVTEGGACRWREWHQREGCEGSDHVVMVAYEPGVRGGARQTAGGGGSAHRRVSTEGL